MAVLPPPRGLFQMASLKSSWSTFSTFVQKFFDRVKKWALDYVEDVVVVMDGTESINNKCEFEKGKKALKGLMSVASYNSRHDTKYAAVTFSCAASVNFKFLTYPSAGNKILSISYPGGGSNTQAGLAEAKKLFDDPSSGIYLFNFVHLYIEFYLEFDKS